MPAVPASPARRPVRRGSKGERTQSRILDAAEDLFAENGYEGTSLRDVAQAVGLRIPSLYNHFPNKEALYGAVLERGIRPVVDLLSALVESGEPPAAGQVIDEVMALLEERPKLPRLLLHETLYPREQTTRLLRDAIAPVFAHAQRAVANSPAARRWSAEQVPLLVLALYHEIVGYFTFAPLYAELNGVDLLAPEALGRHTRFLSDLVGALFPEDAVRGVR